jgi:hypothetical protein
LSGRSAGTECWRTASTQPFTEIAAAEKINESYVDRLLRLTLLAPDIVEAVLGGRQPAEMTLAGLMRPFAVGWGSKARSFHCYPIERFQCNVALAQQCLNFLPDPPVIGTR